MIKYDRAGSRRRSVLGAIAAACTAALLLVPLALAGAQTSAATIDFATGLQAGDTVSILSPGVGITGARPGDGQITVYGSNPDPTPRTDGTVAASDSNFAMIFDASCTGGCSGEDPDLEDPSLGNVLILSEDLDHNDPDDEADGGVLSFDFRQFGTGVVTVRSLVARDIAGVIGGRAPSSLRFIDESGAVSTAPLGSTGAEMTKSFAIGLTGVVQMDVLLGESGAIDNVVIEYERDSNGSTGVIEGLVWNDANNNRTPDPGELPISAVAITLVQAGPDNLLGTADDITVNTATTTDSGAYLFSGLPAGQYRIDIDTTGPLTGLTLTTPPEPRDLTLTTNQTLTTNFGYRQTPPPDAVINGIVWNDANNNQTPDPGELPISAVAITLVQAGPDNLLGTADDITVNTATTTDSGAYLFSGLPAGQYRIDIDTTGPLTGLTLTTPPEPRDLTLTTNQTLTTNFGYRAGSIGDFVWLDLDGDGEQDGGPEAGITGVTVALHLDNDASLTLTAGDELTATATTDAAGRYKFSDLLAGTYLIAVTDVGEVIPQSAFTGGEDPAAVSLGPGEDHEDADFGYQPFITVGDRVWVDVNGNGIQDAAETTGLESVTVSLINPGDDNLPGTADDITVDRAVTDQSGAYLLGGPAGTYMVQFSDIPPGYMISPPNQGADEAIDSNADPDRVLGAPMSLTGGQTILTVDAGAFLTATIGGRISIDRDTCGLFDPRESIPNVPVILSNGQATVTDADGTYEFTVVAGAYEITVDESGEDFPRRALLSVGTNPRPIAITAGETNDTIEFAYRQDNITVQSCSIFGGIGVAGLGLFVLFPPGRRRRMEVVAIDLTEGLASAASDITITRPNPTIPSENRRET